jgi:hypothetical protein
MFVKSSFLVKRTVLNYTRSNIHTTAILRQRPKEYELRVGFGK